VHSTRGAQLRVVWPANIIQLLNRDAAEHQADIPRHGLSAQFFNTLLATPELARNTEIYLFLIEVLNKAPIGFRYYAAGVLCQIGDPLGILHLTYNSLSTHPTLKVRQDQISGWSQAALLRRAADLTDECIELLIAELKAPKGYFQVDVLSAVPSEKIVPRLLPLLDESEKPAMAAAYVLAIKGLDEGRKILENLLESERYVELAVIGISHIPDDKALHYLRVYSDPNHDIYKRHDEALRIKLLRHITERLFLLECRESNRVARAMERFHFHALHDLMANGRESTVSGLNNPRNKETSPSLYREWEQIAARWMHPQKECNPGFFVADARTYGKLGRGVCAPDLLSEFSTKEDRAFCAERQRASIRTLLDAVDSSQWGNGEPIGAEPRFLSSLMPTGKEYRLENYYVPGFAIEYDAEDYEKAAVEWILDPGKYRFGSYHPLASYD